MSEIAKFEDIKTLAEEIKGGFGTRDKTFTDIEKMYLMNDTLPDSVKDYVTISPDARNALLGMARLLTSSNPKWKVPYDKNDTTGQQVSTKLEKFAGITWTAVNRMKGKPVEYTGCLSALLYDELHIAISSMKDVIENAQDAQKGRLEELAAQSPLMFEVISPKICYPVFDNYGLARHFATRKMKVIDIQARWGDRATKMIGDKKPTETMTYNEYWDIENHCVWLSEATGEILLEKHELPYIPIACQVVEGSDLFEDTFETRQPVLYTLYKSGLWKRQNMALSVLYWLTYNLGVSPMNIYKTRDDGKELVIDYSKPGGYVKIGLEESFGPLQKQVIDPAIMEGLTIANEKVAESTIYRAALGEPIGSNAAYSMVAMLSQAGRLPLVPYQRVVSWVIGSAMKIGLSLLREEGGVKKVRDSKGEAIELSKEDIPERFELEANLEIDMPQDERQNVQIALQGSQGEHPLFSNRFGREKYLGIENSDEMDEEIWAERVSWLEMQKEYIQQAQQIQAQMQQLQQEIPPQQGQTQARTQEQPSGMPQGPGQGMPEGMPPDLQQMSQQPGMVPGMPAGVTRPQNAQPGLPQMAPQDLQQQM